MLGLQAVRHRPAHHRSCEDIADTGHIEEAFAGVDVLDVGDPELVRSAGQNLPVDQIARWLSTERRRARPAPEVSACSTRSR